jgi:hypothetical protein
VTLGSKNAKAKLARMATVPRDREAVSNMSQMHLARKGVITEEMAYVAKREKIEPELVRSEVARGRAIIPANIHHRNLEPMGIGIAFKCKINANIGNSATTSNIDEELKKLHHSVHYGADTVMDLSTGGDIPTIRKAIINASPFPSAPFPCTKPSPASAVRRSHLRSHARSHRRAGRTGRGLHDHSTPACCASMFRWCAKRITGNRQPWRLFDGALDGAPQTAKLSL